MLIFGGLNSVWLVVMFDLPVDTKEARRRYAQFRKYLLESGFSMLQFSIYGRHCASDENADVHEKRVIRGLPEKGNVRILRVTEKQFGRMKTFYGKKPRKTEEPPLQLSFF
jgi:CRISPR-associated protein Cas2